MRVTPTLHRARLLHSTLPWEEVDSHFEERIPFDSPTESGDYLRRLVDAGQATRHRLVAGGKTSGIVVTRVETGSLGRELVCLAAYSDARPALSADLAEAIELLARAEHCSSIRFHTVRPGLVKVSCELGYRVSEIVLRKDIV